jgi:ABC-type multidrug transport system fused ATPase/permease subunit
MSDTETGVRAPFAEIRALVRVLSRFLEPAHKRNLLVVSIWAAALSLLEMAVAGAVMGYVQCLSTTCTLPAEFGIEASGMASVPLISLLVFLLITAKLIVQASYAWNEVGFVQRVQYDTLARLIEGYLHLDWPAFRAQNKTHYLRRGAVTAIDAAYVSHQCLVLISSGLTLVVLTALTFWIYPLMSLVLVLGFAAVIGIMQAALGHIQRLTAHGREAALRHWNIGMAEAFASFREIRVYGLEGFFGARLGDAIAQLSRANKRLDFFPALPRIIMDFAIFATVLLVVAIWVVTDRPLSELLPLLVFFAVIARAVLPAMMNILSVRAQLYGSIINIELVLEEFDRNQRQRREKVGIPPSPAPTPSFALDGVTFRHGPGLPAILDGASLTVAHPSWLALVGPSGTGKSTLMEVLSGLEEVESGAVVHAWNGAGGRAAPRVAYVPQHITLLDGSVMENIVFGFDAGDRPRATAALAIAGLLDIVERLEGGLDASVGPEGSRLSGGERQRLALARALYREPDLLLLDEATSGLDEGREAAVLSAIKAARPAMSVLYITHRSSNLRFADSIARLEAGRIVRTA